MQLLKVFASLSTAELTELETRIKGHKNQQLSILFRELKKYRSGKWSLDKEKVYQKVFAQVYTTSNNYQWKNLVASLKKLTYQYLSETEMLREASVNNHFNDVWLLRSLASRRVDDLFVQECERRIREAEQGYDPEQLSQLLSIKSTFHTVPSYQSALSEQEQIDLLERVKNEEIRRLVYRIRALESSTAHKLRLQLNRQDYAASAHQEIELPGIQHIELSDYEDLGSEYFVLEKDSYLLRGQQRVESMIQALDVLREMDLQSTSRYQTEVTLLSNIGQAYSDLNDYEPAIRYQEESMEVARQHLVSVVDSAYFKQLYNHYFLGNYTEVLNYYEQHTEEIEARSFYPFCVLVRCHAYLHLNRSTEASRLAMRVLSSFKGHDQSRRMILVISYLIDGQADDAHREILNLKKSLTPQKGMPDYWPFIIEVFEKYAKIYMLPSSERSKHLNALQKQVLAADPSLEKSSLPFHWLKTQLQ